MNTDLLCVPLLYNLFLKSSMPLHACECSLFVWYTRVYTVFAHSVHTCKHTMCTTSTYCLSHVCTWCACSVHGVHVLCMVCMFCAWCARSVHGVDVPCRVWTFRAWCARSVHGVHVPCMDAVSPLALVRHVSNHSTYTCACT